MSEINIRNLEEIELIRQAAQIVSKTLGIIAPYMVEGQTSKNVDAIAEEHIRDLGAIPVFKGLYNFPASCCISTNAQVIHGIPNDVTFKNGDIVSVDCGAKLNGYCGDHAFTFQIGETSSEVRKLLEITKQSLYKGIAAAKVGNTVGDIGNAVQKHCEAYGFGVVRDFCGHAVGKKVHEEPNVPNYGRRATGVKLQNGMVLALEPMINLGTYRVRTLKDGWTVLTSDLKPSAHFEHNIAIIDGKPKLLSTFNFIYKALGIESDEENEFL